MRAAALRARGAVMGSVLSRAGFYELFRTARHTARRLESRERYDAPEECEALRRFLTGQWTEADERRDRPDWERIVRGAHRAR